MKPSILIVIPTYGHFDYAERAVRSALANTIHFSPSIAVFDDCSPDEDACNKFGGFVLGCQFEYDVPASMTRFHANGGLTRSWNHGLHAAKTSGYEYCCVTNSDVMFPIGWDVEVIKGLEKYALVGPVTNAPGTQKDQYVDRYSVIYNRPTAWADIQKVQDEIGKAKAGWFKELTLNGFCMVAKTETWWANAFDAEHVFRPRNDLNSKGEPNPTPLMTLNEYELQARWHAKGLRSAACLGSYVFHYRAVSRGDKYKQGDWVREEGEAA